MTGNTETAFVQLPYWMFHCLKALTTNDGEGISCYACFHEVRFVIQNHDIFVNPRNIVRNSHQVFCFCILHQDILLVCEEQGLMEFGATLVNDLGKQTDELAEDRVRALDCDSSNDQIYWIDRVNDVVKRSNRDGTGEYMSVETEELLLFLSSSSSSSSS